MRLGPMSEPTPRIERASKRDATHLLDLRGVAMARGELGVIQTLLKEFVIDDAFAPDTKSVLHAVWIELQQQVQAFVEMHDIAMDEITHALRADASKAVKYDKLKELVQLAEASKILKNK